MQNQSDKHKSTVYFAFSFPNVIKPRLTPTRKRSESTQNVTRVDQSQTTDRVEQSQFPLRVSVEFGQREKET